MARVLLNIHLRARNSTYLAFYLSFAARSAMIGLLFFLRYAHSRGEGRCNSVKLRKRHKIVVLFWIPFCTLVAGLCTLIGWAATTSIH
jgi:hypothetical protein